MPANLTREYQPAEAPAVAVDHAVSGAGAA